MWKTQKVFFSHARLHCCHPTAKVGVINHRLICAWSVNREENEGFKGRKAQRPHQIFRKDPPEKKKENHSLSESLEKTAERLKLLSFLQTSWSFLLQIYSKRTRWTFKGILVSASTHQIQTLAAPASRRDMKNVYLISGFRPMDIAIDPNIEGFFTKWLHFYAEAICH